MRSPCSMLVQPLRDDVEVGEAHGLATNGRERRERKAGVNGAPQPRRAQATTSTTASASSKVRSGRRRPSPAPRA